MTFISFIPTWIIQIRSFNFPYYGRYLVKVYRVYQEFRDLYETQEQDSHNLNESLSNIEIDLGISSAFHSNIDSLFLNVIAY